MLGAAKGLSPPILPQEDVINALMASVHIPMFLDYKPCTSYKGELFIDGSLRDFIYHNNSDVLMNGSKVSSGYCNYNLLGGIISILNRML